MVKITIHLIVVLFFNNLNSQTTILHHQTIASSLANTHKLKSGFFVSQTIGQLGPIGSGKTSKHVVQQGFEQSFFGNSSVLIKKDVLFEVKAFPNPFISNLNFLFPPEIKGDVIIDFFDSSGKLIYSVHKFPINNVVNISSLDNLPSGSYIVNLKVDNINQSLKLIKK